ncbi:hypothetical protein [Roseobacter weihaiensis]|uniref:hypothetical protein n=1 Tax=Roseobacter weihaiensis TaxID=2763262 RepID=UPI001D0BDD14|nr:hypothetical protein [Roseobacter sp. H9]
MAFYKGRDGVVKVGTPPAALGHVQSWNVDETADEVRGWGMGDDYDTGFATIARWSGSVEVYLDAADESNGIAIRDEMAVEFYPGGETSGNVYFSGTAEILSLARSASKDGIPMLTINFTGRGALTKATV